VSNSGEQAILMCFDVALDGNVSNERLFFNADDLIKSGKEGGCDGLAVDAGGNIWATGPGGVLIITAEGKHLGTIETGESIANCCFGGPQGDYLYMTSDRYLCRLKVGVKGIGF
jgi:gluconolactonase